MESDLWKIIIGSTIIVIVFSLSFYIFVYVAHKRMKQLAKKKGLNHSFFAARGFFSPVKTREKKTKKFPNNRHTRARKR
jgi:hypothetical protein